jgi:hypothetical protein
MEDREGVEPISDKRADAAAGYLWIFFGVMLIVVVPSILMGMNPIPLPTVPFVAFWTARVLGLLAFSWGIALYARSKGHSPWWGLSGLICIGLIIVLGLPDRNPEPESATDRKSPF